MNEFTLKPMPEIFLLDPTTGKLPENYKEILAQRHKKNSPKNVHDTSSEKEKKLFELKPMPELEFLDPVSGKLPKNVFELVKAKKDRFTINAKPKQHNKEACDKSEFKLQPMPELALINPITGQLPKNYKEILAQRSNTGKNLPFIDLSKNQLKGNKDAKRDSGNCKFKISKVSVKPNVFNKVKPDSNGHTSVKSKTVRKALFTNTGPRRSSILRSRSSQIHKKNSNIQVDDTLPLLDIEESERELLTQKKSKIAFKKPLPTPTRAWVHKKLPSERKRSTGSSSSMEEFIKLEQQCKTPKSIIKRKRREGSDITKHLNNITNKISEIKDLYKEIEGKHKKIEENWKEILQDLSFTEIKENLQLIQDQSVNGTGINLRITTLQNNLKRKVLFDMADSPIPNKSQPVLKAAQTPNTVIRALNKMADEQYKRLQDTPKSTEKRKL